MEPVIIISIVSSLSALVMSIITHVRYSKCSCGECLTTSPTTEKTNLLKN